MRRTPLLAASLAAVLALAGCEAAPTASAESSAPLLTLNQAPVADYKLSVLRANGGGYDYKADGSLSYDPDGSIVAYEWTENGSVISRNSSITFTALRAYDVCDAGWQNVYLKVTDDDGATATACLSYTPLL